MSKSQVPDFNDQQLMEVIELCRRDGKVANFVEQMQPGAVERPGIRLLVESLAYTAGTILDYRKQVREAIAKRQAEEAAKKATEKPADPPVAPRIPSAQIPEMVEPEKPGGNGSPKAE